MNKFLMPSPRTVYRRLKLTAASFAALLVSQSVHAATFTFTGGPGGSISINNGADYTGGTAPANSPGSTDIIDFDSTSYTFQPALDANVTQYIGGLQFGDSTGTAAAALTLSAPSSADTTKQKTSGVTATNSSTITVVNATGLTVGEQVTGGGIPAGTLITAINGNVLTLSRNTTSSTATATQLTFVPTLNIGASGITIFTGVAGVQTISAPVVLSTSQSWTNNSANAGTTGSGIITGGGLTASGNLFLGANTLTLNGSGVTFLSGTIFGTGGLTVNSTGTVAISGANTFTGGVTFSGGTLSLSNAAALGTGLFTVNAGTTLSVTTAVTIANNMQWNGNFNLYTPNKSITLSGPITLAAPLTVTTNNNNSNVPTIGQAVISPNGIFDITKAGSGFLIYSPALSLGSTSQTATSNGGTFQFSGLLTSNAGAVLNIAGTSGTVLISGANTGLAGGITVGSGILNIGNNGALGTGTLTVNGGSIDANAARTTTNNNALNFGGSFTFVGSNTLDLGTGNVTVATPITLTTTASTLTMGGAFTTGSIFDITKAGAGTLAYTHDISLATTPTLTVNAGSENLTGTISESVADSGLIKAGAGTLNLTGTNTYTGPTTIQNGFIRVSTLADVGTASNLGMPATTADGTISLGSMTTAGQLTYIGTGSTTNRVINLAGTTGGAVLDQSGTGTLEFTNAFTATGGGIKTLTLQGSTAGTGLIDGAIVDNSTTLTTSVSKLGSGTWTLAGGNTFTGTITASAGTLVLSGSNANTGNTSISGGILRLVANAGNTTAGGVSSAISANSTLNFTAANTLQLRSDSNVAFNAKTLITGSSSGTFTFDINNVAGVAASGPANNTITLGYTGSFDVSSGNAGHNSGITVTGSNGYSLVLGAVQLQPVGGGSFTNTFTVGTGLGLTFSINGSVLTGNSLAAFTGPGTTTLTSAVARVNQNLSMTLSNGTLNLNGTNNFLNSTTVSTVPAITVNSGTLNLGNAGALNTSRSGVVTNLVLAGGTIDNTGTGANAYTTLSQNITQAWNADFAFTGTNSLNTGTGAVTLGGTGTRTVTVSANTLTTGGIIGDGGSGIGLTKAGVGTLALSGNNTYTGTTTVNSGTLLINGAPTGGGAYLVTGGTLGGVNGTINTGANALTIGGGATSSTITAGTAGTVGMLTLTTTNANGVFFNGVSASNLAIYQADTDSTGVDKLTVNGLLNLSGTFDQISINNTGTLADGTYQLATYTSINGTFDSVVGLADNQSLVYNSNGMELDLVVLTPVPEPSTWLAGLLCVGVMVYGFRRRTSAR